MILTFNKLRHYSPWILTALLYAPVFFVLYRSRWASSDYTHAYFILPVFLWLVWRKRTLLREHLQKINPISNFVGLFILVFGVSMFIFGWRSDSVFIATLSLLPVLYGLISCLYGLKLTKVLFFPILYLILLAPPSSGIVDSITLPMRYGVSVVTEIILKLFHYPITREGLLLSIGNNQLFIGQPCSGFRSLITMFSAGLVYVFLSKANFSKRVILTSSIIPLALLGNLFRIITLCLITYYFGEAAGRGFFHDFSGILVVVIITLGLIGLEYLLGKNIPNTSHQKPQGLVKQLVYDNENNTYKTKTVWITNTLLVFAIIICFGVPKAKTKYTGLNSLSQLKIPYGINGWQGKDVGQEWNNTEDEKLFYISQLLEREYVNNDKKLFLIILDAKNSHDPKVCNGNAGFKVTELNATDIHTSNRKFKAQCLYTKKDGEGFFLIYWVCVDKNIVNWVGQRLRILWFSLFDQKGSNLLVRLDIPCKEEGIEDALNLAKGFISDFSQTIPVEMTDYIFGKN